MPALPLRLVEIGLETLKGEPVFTLLWVLVRQAVERAYSRTQHLESNVLGREERDHTGIEAECHNDAAGEVSDSFCNCNCRHGTWHASEASDSIRPRTNSCSWPIERHNAPALGRYWPGKRRAYGCGQHRVAYAMPHVSHERAMAPPRRVAHEHLTSIGVL